MLRLLLAATALLALSTEAKSLFDSYQKKDAEPRLKQIEGQVYQGYEPVIGRNLLSVFLTDLINIIVAPGTTSYVALLFDLFNFIAMPITGGIMMASVTYNYDLDPITYKNAEMSRADMYASEMKLVKTSMYKAVGKPDFFGAESARYTPPNQADFVDF